jgi:hypothetical protein
MSTDSAKKNSLDLQPERYEIRIQGILDPCWSEWLGCPDVTHTTKETILSCVIPDQAALHGLLAKIRDMNLKLNSVTRVEFEADENEVESHEDKKQ